MKMGVDSWLTKALASLAIVAGLAVTPAMAQATAEACVALEEDAARLACYDALFRTGEPPELGDAALDPVVLLSQRVIPARPSGREPARVMFSCRDGNVEVSFRFASQFVSNTGDIAPLTYQIDSGVTTVRTMRANEDNTELHFASQVDTETFLNSLIDGNNLRVRVTPVRQRSVNVVFSLPEFADGIEALRANCG